jgi:hypothetical protein
VVEATERLSARMLRRTGQLRAGSSSIVVPFGELGQRIAVAWDKRRVGRQVGW